MIEKRLISAHLAFSNGCSYLQSPLVLAIRLFWGYWYMRSGYLKLSDIGEVAVFFGYLNIPMPLAAAYLTATTHLVGGACFTVGLASRLVSIPLAFTMVVAYLTAHFDSIRFFYLDPAACVQAVPFLFLLANVLVIAYGPGIVSLDAWLEKRWRQQSTQL